MQLSSIVGVPLLVFIGTLLGIPYETLESYTPVIWLLFSFSVTLLIVLFLLRKEMFQKSYSRDAASWGTSLSWAIGGVFLSLFAQLIAANIENLLGIETGSENTQTILGVIDTFPIFILITSMIGPILEEIVFRKIIFGTLYKRFNFLLAALISSIIFALAHMEPEHIILYSAMGFTFAFLYVKTKRIIVPIFAHVSMNTFVVLVQSVFKDNIQQLIINSEKIQSIIGGLFQ